MSVSDADVAAAEQRMAALREAGYAVSARYDFAAGRVVVILSTDEELSFVPEDAEELAGAPPEDLAEIEIVPGGLGLFWPRLDAGLYVPALREGVWGSRLWMAGTAVR